MAIRRFSTADLTGRKGSSVIGGYGWGWSEMDSIQTVTVGAGGAASITFSSIPQTYQHLQIRGVLRYSSGTTGEALSWVRFNGDTTTSYAGHILYGTGASATAYAESSATRMWGVESIGVGSTANVFPAGVLDILDYASTTKNKTLRALTGYDANGSGIIFLNSGAWFQTSAVTSISFVPASPYTGFAQFSSLALYGIKG